MACTETEVLFVRLLERTKRLNSVDVATNVWKISCASQLLEHFYSKMQEEKGINKDTLEQYGKEVWQIKMIVQSHQKKSSEDKIAVLDGIPHGFPHIIPIDTNIIGKDKDSILSKGEDVLSSSGLRSRNRAFYQADMRRQLLGEQKRHEEAITNDRKDEITEELLPMIQSMKRNMQLASNVLKEDNKILSDIQLNVDKNTKNLKFESTRLAHHAYKCGFDCMLIFIAIFVFWSFIAMVLAIKMFPKPR